MSFRNLFYAILVGGTALATAACDPCDIEANPGCVRIEPEERNGFVLDAGHSLDERVDAADPEVGDAGLPPGPGDAGPADGGGDGGPDPEDDAGNLPDVEIPGDGGNPDPDAQVPDPIQVIELVYLCRPGDGSLHDICILGEDGNPLNLTNNPNTNDWNNQRPHLGQIRPVAVSSDGWVTYTSQERGQVSLKRHNLITGANANVLNIPNGVQPANVAVSPNGQFIAYNDLHESGHTYVFDTEQPNNDHGILLPNVGQSRARPTWIDNECLTVDVPGGSVNIYKVCLTNPGMGQDLTHNDGVNGFMSISPDGKQGVYTSDQNGSNQLYLVDLETFGVTPETTPEEGNNFLGRWINRTDYVFVSDRTGSNNAFVKTAGVRDARPVTDNDSETHMPQPHPNGLDLVVVEGGRLVQYPFAGGQGVPLTPQNEEAKAPVFIIYERPAL